MAAIAHHLDDAVADFLNAWENRAMKDTLVIVTSDESTV
jgi:predicted AlkP superfamily pyrophosphatase or phosphodiesterase